MAENESSDESEISSTDCWLEALPVALREFQHSPIHWAAIKEFASNLRGTIPTTKVVGMNTLMQGMGELHACIDQLSQSKVEIRQLRERENPFKEVRGVPPNSAEEFEMGPITGRVAPPGTPAINQLEVPHASTFSWEGFPVREAQYGGPRPWETRDPERPIDTRGEGTCPHPFDNQVQDGAVAGVTGGLPGASYSRVSGPGRGDLWDEIHDRITRVMEVYRMVKCFKGNREEFRGWLNTVIAYKDFFHFTDQEMRLALFSLLDGETKRWWEKASSNIATWKEACAAMNNRYDYVVE